jgi:hypothetical protein
VELNKTKTIKRESLDIHLMTIGRFILQTMFLESLKETGQFVEMKEGKIKFVKESCISIVLFRLIL